MNVAAASLDAMDFSDLFGDESLDLFMGNPADLAAGGQHHHDQAWPFHAELPAAATTTATAVWRCMDASHGAACSRCVESYEQ
jgi:hypothetical protein